MNDVITLMEQVETPQPVLTRVPTRAEQWQTMREQTAMLAQVEEMEYDEMLADVAVGMGMHGAIPAGVCAGSKQSNDGMNEVIFPWVRLLPAEPDEKAKNKLDGLYARLDGMEDMLSADFMVLRRKYYKTWKLAHLPSWKLGNETLELLDQFYRMHRPLDYRVQIAVVETDLDVLMLQNIGHDYMLALPKKQQLQCLQRCQEEFVEFGTFLKEQFLAEEAGRQLMSKYVMKGNFVA